MLILLLILASPTLLLAYGVRVHALLPAAAVSSRPSLRAPAVTAETLPGIADAELESFRAWMWLRASQLADTATRRRFLARYPKPVSFDAPAFKEFLMMNRSARVLGVDSFAAVYRAMSPGDRRQDPNPDYVPGRPLPLTVALQMGSIYPDLDRRNQARLLRDENGIPRRTRAGDSIPSDPMTLNMGRMAGLSSQAHAHYGLNREAKSAEPATLKTAPWNFAIATGFPGNVETYGPDNAQIYTDLALLIALDGRPAWRGIGALYAGNAMHYIADVGNAVHTVQVGIYPIFVDATLQAGLRRALHLFGLLGPTPSRNSIGIDIIANLHSMSERLYESELTEAIAQARAGHASRVPPSMQASLHALAEGNDSLAQAIGDTLRTMAPGADAARAIAYEVVDANVRDGAEVYRVTREIIATRLRTGRIAIDFDTVPDAALWRWLRVHRGAVVHTGLDDFNAVHARGLARTTTALRQWWDRYRLVAAIPKDLQPPVAETVLARFVRERLTYLERAERRREEWVRNHGGAR